MFEHLVLVGSRASSTDVVTELCVVQWVSLATHLWPTVVLPQKKSRWPISTQHLTNCWQDTSKRHSVCKIFLESNTFSFYYMHDQCSVCETDWADCLTASQVTGSVLKDRIRQRSMVHIPFIIILRASSYFRYTIYRGREWVNKVKNTWWY